jgi:hypothetical protein
MPTREMSCLCSIPFESRQQIKLPQLSFPTKEDFKAELAANGRVAPVP